MSKCCGLSRSLKKINVWFRHFCILSAMLLGSYSAMDRAFGATSGQMPILILNAAFLTNAGNPLPTGCDQACLANLILGSNGVSSYFQQESNSLLTIPLSGNTILNVQLNIYASNLGCAYKNWMDQALLLASQQGVNVSQFPLVMLFIPKQAGGGSCSRVGGVGWVDPTTGHGYSMVRTPSTLWMTKAISESLGLVAATSSNATQGDLSDPSGIVWSYTDNPIPPSNPTATVPNFNAPHLNNLGWFPNPGSVISQTDNKSPIINTAVNSVSSVISGVDGPALIAFGPYWISFRSQSDADAGLQANWNNSLYVHANPNYSSSPGSPPVNPLVSTLVTQPLHVGDTFTDPSNNTIIFESIHGETANIQLHRCQQNPPSLVLQPGSENQLNIVVTNNDIECPVSPYRLTAQCSGAPCAFSPNSPTDPLQVTLNILWGVYPPAQFTLAPTLAGTTISPTSQQGQINGAIYTYDIPQSNVGETFQFTITQVDQNALCMFYGNGSPGAAGYELAIGNALYRYGCSFDFVQTTSFPALPSTMLSNVANGGSASTALSFATLPLGGEIQISLTQLDPNTYLSNGRPVVTKTFVSGFPTSQIGTKLVGAGSTGLAAQGSASALSADGGTLIVGGNSDNASVGGAWVYTRSQGKWIEQGPELIGTGAVGSSQQGRSVALSADGNTALVGGSGDQANAGAVWVFTRSQGVWSQQGQKLVPHDAQGASRFGNSVALSSDGTTAVIGGPFDANNVGAAWVFTRNSNGIWTQMGQKLVGTHAIGISFQGYSVAISTDLQTLAIGGMHDQASQGAVWVFVQSNGSWVQQAKVTGTDASPGSYVGFSMSLGSDGNTLVTGGPFDEDSNGNQVGAVRVFSRASGVWTQQGTKLIPSDYSGTSPWVGYSVATNGAGNLILIGGKNDNSGVGASWLFTNKSGKWTQYGKKLIGTDAASNSQQGSSVSLSSDGNVAAIGGPLDARGVGAVWLFGSN